jgi:hypothetical protein
MVIVSDQCTAAASPRAAAINVQTIKRFTMFEYDVEHIHFLRSYLESDRAGGLHGASPQ